MLPPCGGGGGAFSDGEVVPMDGVDGSGCCETPSSSINPRKRDSTSPWGAFTPKHQTSLLFSAAWGRKMGGFQITSQMMLSKQKDLATYNETLGTPYSTVLCFFLTLCIARVMAIFISILICFVWDHFGPFLRSKKSCFQGSRK